MKKILSAVLAVAFLFSVAPVFAAIEIGDGLTLSGVGNIFFQGGGRGFSSYIDHNDNDTVKKREYQKGNDGIYVGALTVTKTFEDGAEAGITIKAGSGSARFGANDAQKPNSNDVVIAGLWYQQPFLDNSLKVKVGRVGTIGSGNAVAGSADTQFINPMFTGDATKVGPWDDGADPYGIVVTYSPIELIDISYNYAAANGEAAWYDEGEISVTVMENGIPTPKTVTIPFVSKAKTYSVDKEGFNAIEVNVKPFENGNYRVAYWTLAEKVLYRAPGTPSTIPSESVSPSGLLFSIDQEVIENVSVFARFGLQLEEKAIDIDNTSERRWDAYTAKQAWSLGGQVKGAFWSRDNDVVGAAVGQKTYTDEGTVYSTNGIPVSKVTPSQLVSELYYKYTVSETVSVSPSVQYIKYTNFGDVDSEFAYALRVNYSF